MILVILIVLFTGIITSIVTYFQCKSYLAFRAQAKQTEGVIVGKKRFNKLRDVPIVEFTDDKGRTIRVKRYLWSVPFRLHIGHPITVYYDPKDPKKRVAVESGIAGKVETILVITVELAILLFGLVLSYGYFTGHFD